jgi:hypothetical protein
MREAHDIADFDVLSVVVATRYEEPVPSHVQRWIHGRSLASLDRVEVFPHQGDGAEDAEAVDGAPEDEAGRRMAQQLAKGGAHFGEGVFCMAARSLSGLFYHMLKLENGVIGERRALIGCMVLRSRAHHRTHLYSFRFVFLLFPFLFTPFINYHRQLDKLYNQT